MDVSRDAGTRYELGLCQETANSTVSCCSFKYVSVNKILGAEFINLPLDDLSYPFYFNISFDFLQLENQDFLLFSPLPLMPTSQMGSAFAFTGMQCFPMNVIYENKVFS